MAHAWNHNIRFSMADENAMKAWVCIHSEEVKESFKSQNAFVIAAINDYYERHLIKKDDPYLETREKEDEFCNRIVEKVEGKVLANLPALLGAYLLQQQTQMAVNGQMSVPMVNANATMNQKLSAVVNNTGAEHQDSIREFESDELEENDLLDLSMGF